MPLKWTKSRPDSRARSVNHSSAPRAAAQRGLRRSASAPADEGRSEHEAANSARARRPLTELATERDMGLIDQPSQFACALVPDDEIEDALVDVARVA